MTGERCAPLVRPPQWAHTAAAAHARTPSARARSSLNALFGALIAIVGATGVAVVLGHPIGELAVHLSAVRSASLGTVMSAFLSLVWTVPIGVLVVVAHECGHVAGGLLVGWSFRLLFIGPVRIVRVRGRLRAEWHRLSYLHGGAALVTPRRWETARQFRRHRCWVVVGGPLASLLLACLAALSVRARSSPGVDIPHASLSVQFQAFTAFLSLMIGVGTLLPFRMGHGMRSDGLRLVRLLRVPTSATGRAELDAEDHRLQALLTALYLRPREWPDELVAQLSTLRGSEGLVMQYYRALDQAHWELRVTCCSGHSMRPPWKQGRTPSEIGCTSRWRPPRSKHSGAPMLRLPWHGVPGSRRPRWRIRRHVRSSMPPSTVPTVMPRRLASCVRRSARFVTVACSVSISSTVFHLNASAK